MRILRGQSNLEVSSKGFALFVVGLVLATFVGGAVRTILSSDQVHRRIVSELKNRFPKQEFQIGQTEVLLSRGLWPGLGLRVHGLIFKQDVCGKLSFVLTIPQATLPLDILSLRTGQVRLNDIQIEGGGIHLDYRDCPPRASAPAPGTDSVDAAVPLAGPKHKSIATPKLNWQEAAQFVDGVGLKNFTVTYEKNPTWKLVFNRAYAALSDELKGEAQVDIRKSLPFGELSHPLSLSLHGDKSVLQWSFNADFKEGHILLNGSLDLKNESATSALAMRQVPIKDFMSEMFQMGLVEHDLKLKATWLTCALKWEGHLRNYDETPVKVSDCRVEGGYGHLQLAEAEFWLNNPEYFRPPARLKVAQLEIGPLVEALNRQVLPAVLPRLGVWNGNLEFSSGESWRLDGHLQNLEIVFSNQSTHGKQNVDSIHTLLGRANGKTSGKVDEVKVREGDFAGTVDFELSNDWRDGGFNAQIEKLTLSPMIQKIMVGGSVGPLKIQGEGTLLAGELNQWAGTFSVPEMRGEGWRSENVQVRSRFERGVFHVEGSVKNATVDTAWGTFEQMRSVRADLPEQMTWRDLSAKVDILKTGGNVQSIAGTEALNGLPWRVKGTWVRDGEFIGVLNVGQGKKPQTFALHGEKGLLTVQDEPGVSR